MAQPSRSPSFAQENLSDRRTVGRAAARVRKCEDGADSHEGVVAPYAPSTSRTAAFSGRAGCRRRPVDSDDLRSERTAIRCHRRWRPRIIRKRSSGTTYGPTRCRRKTEFQRALDSFSAELMRVALNLSTMSRSSRSVTDTLRSDFGGLPSRRTMPGTGLERSGAHDVDARRQ